MTVGETSVILVADLADAQAGLKESHLWKYFEKKGKEQNTFTFCLPYAG